MNNDYLTSQRHRGKTLLIVEGHHEKNKLFWLLFHAFPELKIRYDDIWIYGTNIYMLYQNIVDEYGEKWAEDDDDIDLPFVVSKKINPKKLEYKNDFTNIFLVFDYERHDPNFDKDKITNMQERFNDSADMGKLFINYPMVESYQHFTKMPDPGFADRFVMSSIHHGHEYKNIVKRVSGISKIIRFPHQIKGLLEEYLGISDPTEQNRLANLILELHRNDDLLMQIQKILPLESDYPGARTLRYTLKNKIDELKYLQKEQTYWEYMRSVFKNIIISNACKANKILNDKYEICKEEYESLDLAQVLGKQNKASENEETGIIWVLNTSVFMVADYNYLLVSQSLD